MSSSDSYSEAEKRSWLKRCEEMKKEEEENKKCFVTIINNADKYIWICDICDKQNIDYKGKIDSETECNFCNAPKDRNRIAYLSINIISSNFYWKSAMLCAEQREKLESNQNLKKFEDRDFRLTNDNLMDPQSPPYRLREKSWNQGLIKQGALGDCWLISMIIGLDRIKKIHFFRSIFTQGGLWNKDGMYNLILYDDGYPRLITIDDRLPFNESLNEFINASCPGGEIWGHYLKRQ